MNDEDEEMVDEKARELIERLSILIDKLKRLPGLEELPRKVKM